MSPKTQLNFIAAALSVFHQLVLAIYELAIPPKPWGMLPHIPEAKRTYPGKANKMRLTDTCGYQRQIGTDGEAVSGKGWRRDPM